MQARFRQEHCRGGYCSTTVGCARRASEKSERESLFGHFGLFRDQSPKPQTVLAQNIPTCNPLNSIHIIASISVQTTQTITDPKQRTQTSRKPISLHHQWDTNIGKTFFMRHFVCSLEGPHFLEDMFDWSFHAHAVIRIFIFYVAKACALP